MRVKLREDSGTCFQFLKRRCTVTTSPVTHKFVSLLSERFQEHPSGSNAPPLGRPLTNTRLSHLLRPLPRLTCPLPSLAPIAERQHQGLCGAWAADTVLLPGVPLALQGAICMYHADNSWTQITSTKQWVTSGDKFPREGRSIQFHFPQHLGKGISFFLQKGLSPLLQKQYILLINDSNDREVHSS